jgi:penicillin-binding protein 2
LYRQLFHCNVPGGHGVVDVHEALAKSCNVFFWQVGVRLEIDRIAAWAKRMGLGKPTGIDLPHELGGLMPSPEWKRRVQKAPWYPGETVSVAIGQGQVTATPLQMARVAALIANGGRLVRPRLVRGAGGGDVPLEPPQPLGISEETLVVVKEGLKAVVARGTGWRARLSRTEVCGKTGLPEEHVAGLGQGLVDIDDAVAPGDVAVEELSVQPHLARFFTQETAGEPDARPAPGAGD